MRQFLERLGWPILITTALIPVFLWQRFLGIQDRVVDIGTLGTSVGQLLGLVGMIFFAHALILSARLRIFEYFFGGMNRVYIAHHQAGGIGFILLMIHPLLLTVSYLSESLRSAALFLLGTTAWPVLLGISSLLTLMTLLFLTYYVNLAYPFWRFTHKFLGLAFFLGGLHAFFIDSDIAHDPTLRAYMLGFSGLALLFFLYRTILGRFLVRRIPFRVDAVTPLTGDVLEIQLSPLSAKPFRFRPGQFLFLSFEGAAIGNEVHPFSISSSPEGALTLTVKSLGDYTRQLVTLPPGTIAQVEGPFGGFSYVFTKSRDQVWIAGGIGITPFVSMARTLQPEKLRVDLYYTVKDESEAVYLAELTAISERNQWFRTIAWYSKTMGRLTAGGIEHTSAGLRGKEFFICGPPAMMLSMKKQLQAMGIAKHAIHSEEFTMLT